MIKISEYLFLKEITNNEVVTLFELMKEIYPLAYHHFWKDSGDWYINSQYSKEKVLQELSQENADYYFVIYNDEIIGNFRIIWDEKLKGLYQEKQVKLHRLYLHQKMQGKSLGKTLLSWLEKNAVEKGYRLIWLEAMDEQPQAYQFYKKRGFQYHSHTFLPFELMHKEFRKISQFYKLLI